MSGYRVRRNPRRPVDWSMDLLNVLRRTALDPDYAAVAADGTGGKPLRSPMLLLVGLLVGALFTIQVLATFRAAPAAERERQELIARVKAADAEQEGLKRTEADLEKQVQELQVALLGGEGRVLQKSLDDVGSVTGQRAVKGPGLVIQVDDAPDSTKRDTRVVDVDLRRLVNSLWESGAEAIAINGHRLSARTAIRGAGSAITVDYRSLNRPYKVEAIGDPKNLEARLAASPGGAWWVALRANYGMQYDVTTSSSLTLAADPGLGLRQARAR